MAGKKRRSGRRAETEFMPAIAAATEGALAETVGALPADPRASVSDIEKSGLMGRVAELRYAGRSCSFIGNLLGFSADTVERLVKSERFLSYFDQHIDILNEKIDEAARVRVQAAYLKAIDDLIESRDKAKGFLRRQLNMDIIELNQKYAGIGKGSISSKLKAIHEVTSRRKDGSVVKERIVTSGPAAAVAAEVLRRRRDEQEGGGPGPRSDGSGVGEHGGEGEDPGRKRIAEAAADAEVEGILEDGSHDDSLPAPAAGGQEES